jgi:hypothetical protein
VNKEWIEMRIFKNKMFFKWAKSEGLTDSILKKAVEEVDQGLVDAHLGSHLIKKRVARKGQGKRGGFRSIVIFQKGHRTFFIYGFPKNQRDNINEQEEKGLKKLAQDLLKASDRELNEMIINGDLYEVGNE